MQRRSFLAGAAALTATMQGVDALAQAAAIPPAKLARIAMSTSSYRMNYEGRFNVASATPKLSHRTFPAYVKEKFGVTKIELWDQQFGAAGTTFAECRAIRAAADAAGVRVVSVEVESTAPINAADADDRAQALAEAKVWLDKAQVLGCTSMRFNTNPRGALTDGAVDVIRQMGDYGQSKGVIVLLENHGGATGAPPALLATVKRVNHPNVKAEPDWGPSTSPEARYDEMKALMEVTHIVSAKGLVFDPVTYAHTSFDVARLVREAEATGYRGVYSVELYNNPPPADTDKAVASYIKTITDNMA
jgi:sugar phosphate isomerase/epimerase